MSMTFKNKLVTVNRFIGLLFAIATMLSATNLHAASEYEIGAGDIIRITVFEHPDLSTVTRVSENNTITFPLVGELKLGQSSVSQAESLLAAALSEGGFVRSPQVNIIVEQFRSQQVSVLGQVRQPGQYPIEGESTLVDLLAMAGGVTDHGADRIKLIKQGDGAGQIEIDLIGLFNKGDLTQNSPVKHGDIVYVPRMDVFYIYGQVQRPGVYRLERDMTAMQALAVGGGLTGRGTEKGMSVKRRKEDGTVISDQVNLTDKLHPDDVIYIKESMF